MDSWQLVMCNDLSYCIVPENFQKHNSFPARQVGGIVHPRSRLTSLLYSTSRIYFSISKEVKLLFFGL